MSIDDVSVAIFDLERYSQSAPYSHAANVQALVLERLPNGEHAWLRPSTEPAEDDEARYWPTPRGRDYLARLEALRWLFP